MDYSRETPDDFHTSFEPMVIINDEESIEQAELKDDESDPLAVVDPTEDDLINSIGPEISIIPVNRKRPHFKIKIFEREYSPSNYDTSSKVQSTTRSSREKVRRISIDEAEKAADTYARRKSNPLEKCPVCKKYFRRLKTHLIKHNMITRSAADNFFCMLCQKSFNSQSNLAIHMRTHNGMRPYICEVCQKSFSQSCNLVNHMRVHTGEKPFKCPHCDRAFTQSGNLNNHIRLHTDDKPFKCHFCPKAFVQSGNLNSHIRNNHKFETNTFNPIAHAQFL